MDLQDLVSPGVTLSPTNLTARSLLIRNQLIQLYYLAGYTTSRVQRLIASNGFFLSKRHIRRVRSQEVPSNQRQEDSLMTVGQAILVSINVNIHVTYSCIIVIMVLQSEVNGSGSLLGYRLM